jgi:hypothetical protein
VASLVALAPASAPARPSYTKELARKRNLARDVGVHGVLGEQVDGELRARLRPVQLAVEREHVGAQAPDYAAHSHAHKLRGHERRQPCCRGARGRPRPARRKKGRRRRQRRAPTQYCSSDAVCSVVAAAAIVSASAAAAEVASANSRRARARRGLYLPARARRVVRWGPERRERVGRVLLWVALASCERDAHVRASPAWRKRRVRERVVREPDAVRRAACGTHPSRAADGA